MLAVSVFDDVLLWLLFAFLFLLARRYDCTMEIESTALSLNHSAFSPFWLISDG